MLAGEPVEREILTTAILPRRWLSCEKLISVSLAPLASDWNASRMTTVLWPAGYTWLGIGSGLGVVGLYSRRMVHLVVQWLGTGLGLVGLHSSDAADGSPGPLSKNSSLLVSAGSSRLKVAIVPYPNSESSLQPHALQINVPKSTSDLIQFDGRACSAKLEYGTLSAIDGSSESTQS